MAKKIFISYKHEDDAVRPLDQFGKATARDYVDLLEVYFKNDHIYKGEKEGEDLGGFKDDTIESHLRDNIFDSSVTIVLVSKNMKELGVSEEDQWIPWEISYSLKEKTREGRTSTANAMLAVVLPDENDSYRYFVEQNSCPYCNSVNWKNKELFNILGKNMFSRKQPKTVKCSSGMCGKVLHTGDDHSYIYPVKRNEFISNINKYIDLATRINEKIEEYEMVKVI